MCGLSAPREGSLEDVMRGDQAPTAVGTFRGNLFCKLLFKEGVLIWFPCELHKFFALNLFMVFILSVAVVAVSQRSLLLKNERGLRQLPVTSFISSYMQACLVDLSLKHYWFLHCLSVPRLF